MPISEVYNEDCMIGMARYPDKFFDLAIVDPPYGIDASNMTLGEGGGLYRKPKKYKRGDWDKNAPDRAYFGELFRVSKNQIVWGANHFISKIPIDSSCWILWDKNNGESDFADGEAAWTSFKSPLRIFKFTWSGFIQGNMKRKQDKIHPTQKPTQLYQWLLKKYANEGDKILDTHLGSGSSRIAAYKSGFDFWGWEIDEDYFREQQNRFEKESHEPLFAHIHPTQSQIF